MLYDKDIREPLFSFLEETYGKVRIIEEKRVGRSRADLVMVIWGAVVGLEIKSDADSYARLSGQIEDYDQYFDYNFIVVGTSHAMHIEEHVPPWWGIITVEEETDLLADFYILRKPKDNPRMDPVKKLSLLWRPELVHLLELNGLPKYKEKSKVFVIQKLEEKVPGDLLRIQISQELFERDYNEIADTIRRYRTEQGKPLRKKRKRRIRRTVLR